MVNSELDSQEQLWRESRAGARAGSGFRFQDAVGVYACVLFWRRKISGESVTPESLDDFAMEGSPQCRWVQAKSKVNAPARFSSREIARIILDGPGEDTDLRAVVLDRAFQDIENEDWSKTISQDSVLKKVVLGAARDDRERQLLRIRLANTSLITVPNPLRMSATEISNELGCVEAAGLACSHSLLQVVGNAASENARTDFTSRRSVSGVDVQTTIDSTMKLIDIDVVELAVRRGIARWISFHESVDDLGFYEGVSVQPGHVAAGLVESRPDEVETIVHSLMNGRNVLVAGPSGAGKSALCYLAAFETRHAFRWVEAVSVTDADQETLLQFLGAQAASLERPLFVYVDDVGRGGEAVWQWLCAQSRHIHGLSIVGSVREEDVALLYNIGDVTIIRPTLTEELAGGLWCRLAESGCTRLEHWREAFDDANGLLLEYTHILTKGRRLGDVVYDQVRRRVQEARHTELALLPMAAATAALGAAVNSSDLVELLSMTNIDFAEAYLRLRGEHLVGEERDGRISGLHELRSQAILDAVCELLALDVRDVTTQAIGIVVPEHFRRMSARAARRGLIDELILTKCTTQRLEANFDPVILTGSLEAMKLIAIENDATVFKKIADEFNISHREYFLCLLLPDGSFTDSLCEAPVFKHLAEFRRRLEAERSKDYRSQLLGEVAEETLEGTIARIESPEQALRLTSALYGDPLEALSANLCQQLDVRFQDASIDQIAEYLAVQFESGGNAAWRAAATFGGSHMLLERLWRETQWALKPTLSKNPDGLVEVEANVLAATDEHAENLDGVTNEYAVLALQLCPEAAIVSSRPLQLSGEVISVNGWTPGYKRFEHAIARSKTSVAWNRMLLHAVANQYGAPMWTEVLQRYRYNIEQAAKQIERAADRFCRGLRFLPKHKSEAKALEIIENVMPPPPIGRPEDQIDNPLGANITDPVGALIVDVAQLILCLADRGSKGFRLMSDAESVVKAIAAARDLSEWTYIGGPPADDLYRIENVARSLRRICLAIGDGTVANSGGILPKRRQWSRGTGIERANQWLTIQWIDGWTKKRSQIEGALGARAFAKETATDGGIKWPDWDLCLIVSCETVLDFYTWIEEQQKFLSTLVDSCGGLSIAPALDEKIAVQLAISVTSVGVLPSETFLEDWEDQLHGCRVYISRTLIDLKRAQKGLLSCYAAQEHLSGRDLLLTEEEQIQLWADEAKSAFELLSAAAENDPEGAGAVAFDSFMSIYTELGGAEETNGGKAIELIRAEHMALVDGELNDQALSLAAPTWLILANELGVLTAPDEIDADI